MHLRLARALVLAHRGPARGRQRGPVVVIDPGHDLPRELRDRADRARLGDAEDQGRRRDERRRDGHPRGRPDARRLAAAAQPCCAAPGVDGRDDADADGGDEHGQHRARADRESRGRGALPPRPRRRLIRARASAGTHTLVPALRAGWTDDVYRASRRAASVVQRELVRALGFPDRGIQERADFTGFNWADVPVILVELGFMTNPAEDRALARAAVRAARGARALPRARSRFLGLDPRAARFRQA